MSFISPSQAQPVGVSAAVNCAQAAGTYTLLTAVGDVLIVENRYLQITAGATFTSLAIQTNDTTPAVILTAAEGAVANLTAQKNIVAANTDQHYIVKSGKLIQMTLVGTTGTGTGTLGLMYVPLTAGAYLA